MNNIYNKMLKILENINGILLFFMCTLIAVQVFCRYVIFYSLPWSEELCRYLYIWMVLLGVSFGIKNDNQIRIDIVDVFVRGKAKLFLRLVSATICLGAIVTIGISSIPMIQNAMNTSSATLGICMMWVYLVFPISMFLSALQSLLNIKDIACELIGKGGK